MTVFSARKLHRNSSANSSSTKTLLPLETTSLSPEPRTTSDEEEVLLTKTDKYTVSKLSKFPQLLESTFLSSGTISAQFAAVVDDNNVHLWNYSNSTSSSPITLSFPYDNTHNNGKIKPIVKLIPNELSPNDPGLIILDPITGHLKYYESIINAPLLKVLNFKIFELNLKLNNDEFITIVEFINDLGLIMATSTQKLILVTLTDEFNKPQLNKIDITNPNSSSFNFINSIFSHTHKSYDDINEFNIKNNKILAIRDISPSSLPTTTRQILVQDSNSNFEIWEFNNRKSISSKLKLNLKDSLCSFLKDIYDNINFSFKILDLLCLKEISNDVFLILSSFDVDNNDSHNNYKNLVLFTLKISQDGVFIYSTYKITCFNAQLHQVPHLILPKPYNTCYIIVDNSIILAQVITSLDPLKLAQLNYKTKWEDLISLKKSVEIVGYGSESNNEIIVITSNSGLLRINKLDSINDDDYANIDELDWNLKLQQEPMLFIKSHIEQAVYFGTDQSLHNPMYFQIPKTEDFNAKDVEIAILNVLNELISNESKYLPKVYPSVEIFLQKKNQFVSTLTEFILWNFKDLLSSDLKILILNLLNKFQIALNFYSIIKLDSKLMSLTRDIILTMKQSQDDVIRDFFFNNLSDILQVIYQFILQSKDNSRILQLLSSIGVSYLNFEKTVRYDKLQLDNDYDFITKNKPLFIENDQQLLIEIVKFYNSSYSNKDNLSVSQREQLVNLSEFLFYSFNDILCYYKSQDLTLYNEIFEIYELNKFKWIEMLSSYNKDSLVLQISESFKDMTSIVEILLTTNKDDSTLQYYFDKFGYQFAIGYYTYLIDHKFFTKLFAKETLSYLNRFFNDFKQFNKFYWIFQLQNDEYSQLCTTLMGLEDELLTNKQWDLSLAKISLLQSESNDDKSIIDEINYHLQLCEYQQEIEPNNDQLPRKISEKLQQNKILTIYELIDLLSSIKSDLNFYKAYKIIKNLNDYEEFKLLFTRLLLIDDWDFLNDQNKTDEYLTSMVKSTITFKTIDLIKNVSKDPFDLSIDKLINKNKSHQRYEDDPELVSQLDDQLKALDTKYQLNDWIQSIISMTQD